MNDRDKIDILCMNWLKLASLFSFTSQEEIVATDCQENEVFVLKLVFFRVKIWTHILEMVQACTTAIVLLYCI